MTEPACPSRRQDLVCRELDGELILFDPLTNVTHRLNQTASLVYLSCDGLTSTDEIVKSYENAFEVSSTTSHHDVHQVLSSLEKLALLNYEA